MTKYYGGVSNTIMIAAQMPVFWVLKMLFTAMTIYHLEIFTTGYILMKIFGFAVLIVGVLIYFKRIKFPQPAQVLVENSDSRLSDAGRARMIS